MLKEFRNDIYPRRLWVATSWEEVKDKFTSDYELKETENNLATTYPRVNVNITLCVCPNKFRG